MADTDTTETPVESERDETSDAPPEPDESAPQDSGDVPPEVKAALKKANEEAKNLRLKLKEYEDRDKTEAERISERLAEAEKRALDADRLEIALEKGLTKSQAKRLVGSTREELEADADELLADLGVNPDDEKPAPSRRPQERLRSGAVPDAEPEETDPAKLAEMVQKAKYGF